MAPSTRRQYISSVRYDLFKRLAALVKLPTREQTCIYEGSRGWLKLKKIKPCQILIPIAGTISEIINKLKGSFV